MQHFLKFHKPTLRFFALCGKSIENQQNKKSHGNQNRSKTVMETKTAGMETKTTSWKPN
jgi:hypothetical protein